MCYFSFKMLIFRKDYAVLLIYGILKDFWDKVSLCSMTGLELPLKASMTLVGLAFNLLHFYNLTFLKEKTSVSSNVKICLIFLSKTYKYRKRFIYIIVPDYILININTHDVLYVFLEAIALLFITVLYMHEICSSWIGIVIYSSVNVQYWGHIWSTINSFYFVF